MKIEKRLFLLFIILVLTLFVSEFVSADTCGGIVRCHCGDILVESQTMWYDLEDCSDDGLVIGANGIILNCNGHLIDGENTPQSSGIFVQSPRFMVKNCNIKEFGIGIAFWKTSYENIIIGNNINNNQYDGILLGDYYVSNNILVNNTITNNGRTGIFVFSNGNYIWDNIFMNNDINAKDEAGANNWNFSNVGNSWSDFSSNPGFPYYYEIPGGDGIDWHPSFVEFYVDNSDEEFRIISGEWNSRNHPNAYNGETNYNDPGFGLERAGWKVNNLVFPGTYEVYVWKFEHEYSNLMGTNVHYMIYHRTGTSNWILVDQSTPGNEWVYLGEFEFDDSHRQGVMITDEANGYVAADAIKLIYTGPLTDAESSWAEVFLI